MAEKAKILIIDDEEDFAYFIKLNLESTDRFEVLTSTSGQDGINLAMEKKPDLIFIDILMPEMHGTEVAEILLQNRATKSIPMIYLTAVATKKDVETKGGVIGGRQFIAKPVTAEELIEVIESVLGDV
ncbi:MAG: response regulator [Deltaproteobacteria bacterium]|nr:response regulator [Deltaproteobacteria bacterium]